MALDSPLTPQGLATAIYWAFTDFALVKILDMGLKREIPDVDFPALRVWTFETLPLMCRPSVVVKSDFAGGGWKVGH